jgi:hypothetical protein
LGQGEPFGKGVGLSERRSPLLHPSNWSLGLPIIFGQSRGRRSAGISWDRHENCGIPLSLSDPSNGDPGIGWGLPSEDRAVSTEENQKSRHYRFGEIFFSESRTHDPYPPTLSLRSERRHLRSGGGGLLLGLCLPRKGRALSVVVGLPFSSGRYPAKFRLSDRNVGELRVERGVQVLFSSARGSPVRGLVPTVPSCNTDQGVQRACEYKGN